MSFVLHKLLADSARRRPAHPAVVDGDRSLTYAELDAHANRIAQLLADRGVRRGDRVGLFLDKSLEAVTGIYGILKAGAGYVSIDVRAPASRAAYIVGNCGIETLITATAAAEGWKEIAEANPGLRNLVVLDAADASQVPPAPDGGSVLTAGDVAGMPAVDPDAGTIDQDLAYIIYTSGSTGAPKGVMLNHLNALTFVHWTVEEFGVNEDDRLSSHAPFHFDLSIFDLYAAAKTGATVYLVPPRASVFPVHIKKFIDHNEITVWYSVPSVLSMLVQRGKLTTESLPSLRTILFAGEVFPTKFLQKLMQALPHVEFANLYGPTETNVCTFYRVPEPPDPADGDIPIGRAIANVHCFVVTDDGRPAEPGEVGELYVRGSTVMAGYWGDPEKTAQRLVPDPFAGELVYPVYRTGDLVRERPDGNYDFLGRRDNQIKSRGYRIELGEIETAIYQHPAVVEAAVVAIPDDLVTNRIKAYVSVRSEVADHELKRFCGERVPPYMVPETVEIMEALPKTSTGKIDRQTLIKANLKETE